MKKYFNWLLGIVLGAVVYFMFTYNDEAKECLEKGKLLSAQLSNHTIPESEVEQYSSFYEMFIGKYPECEEHLDGGGTKEEKCERALRNKHNIDKKQAELGNDPLEEIRLHNLEKQYLDAIYRNCNDRPGGYEGK